MRRLASLLALAAILGAALFRAAPASAAQPERKVGSFVAVAHVDIWKHSDGTWQKGLYNGKENVTEDAAYDPKALGIDTAGYKLTRVTLTYPFGEAEYNAAGKRYGTGWEKFKRYYERRALIHEVKVKSFDAATGKTAVEWRFDLKRGGAWRPWDLTDPTIREELGITPPPGFADAVEGYRYELPVIITWYGVPITKPPDFSVSLDKDEYRADPGDHVTVKATFRLNKEHPCPETARLTAYHVVGGKEYPVALKPAGPADALRPDGTADFDPGEAKAYTFQVAVQSEPTRIVVKVNPWSVSDDADWSNNRDEAPVVPNLVDVAVKISPIKSPVWIWWGSKTGTARAGANTTVMRLDGLPVEAEVRAAISGPAGREEYRIRLGPGRRYNKPYFFTAGPGTYAVSIEAWPVGMKDADPSNNKASTQIKILKQRPPETGPREPGLHVELGS